MEVQCSKCNAHIATLWKYCPHCGAVIRQQPLAAVPAASPADPAKPEKAPVRWAFTGLLFGMLAVPILAIVGTMLCLTGLGAILGVPMILVAVLAPLLGPMIGIGAMHGTCPWCGIRIHSIITVPEFYCHGCSKPIVIEKRKFLRAA
jgi:hypothetical protein